MAEGHILKFVHRQQSPTRLSKRMFPQQKCGQSKQSPDWFNKKFSLQPTSGYEYKHDEAHIKQKFKYQSQKNTFNVTKQQHNNEHEQNTQNNAVHNRKKGLLSEYLDKNAWMKVVIPLTGLQRNQESRKLNNQDRQKNIETIQFRKSAYISAKTASNFYSTNKSKIGPQILSRQTKTTAQHNNEGFFQNKNPQNLIVVSGKSINQISHSRSRSIPTLMGQKQKIRSQRLQLVKNKMRGIQKFKLDQTLISRKLKTIDSQFVQQRMALTARQWGGKKVSPYKSIERFDQMIGWNQRSQKRVYRGFLNKKLSTPIQTQNMMQLFQSNQFISNQL